ncbi:hypothetical protein ACLI1A_00700 [Flavobacterium sp. RHBU_3]|uniref:hypothetical protein n=1 Tax=Flavobacterium sp. RHBU_3 TaxID=3391184 RepID=UPI003984D8FE
MFQVISYHKIRRAIGFIGICLPFVLWTGNALLNYIQFAQGTRWIKYNGNYVPATSLKPSISHFYYTTMGEVFTGALCAVALFLFCYKGYERRPQDKVKWIPGDNFMANAAGIFALGVVLCPTSGDVGFTDNFRAFVSTEITGYIHYSFAALFFLTLALMSMFNFRRTADPNDFGEMKSHPLYLWCGIIMISCMLVLGGIFVYGKKHPEFLVWTDKYSVTYWLETVMLLAFGFSWLAKGEVDQMVFNTNILGNGQPKSTINVNNPTPAN